VNYTDNYNLRKPELTDPVDIDDLNYNADEIDSLLKGLADGLDGITPEGIGAETPTGAQQKANQAETNAKSYADQVASDLSNQAETNAKSYADIVANGVLNSAKDYADIVTNNALNSAKDYADGVLESANSHTDQVASDLSQKLNETRIKVLDVEQDVSNINKVLINLNPNHEAKQTVSSYGTVTLPKNAAKGQISAILKGNTWTNRAGIGDTSPQTIENLDSAKTYLLIKTDGGTVNVDAVDTAVPAKITGKTSTVLTWASGKIALYELSTAEAALTEAELGARYHYVDGTKSTVGAMRLKSVSEDESEVSTAYVTAKDEEDKISELRSLPNGTKDEIRVSENKAILKTGQVILNGSELWIYHIYAGTYDIHVFKILNWRVNNNSVSFNGVGDNKLKAVCFNIDGNLDINTSYDTLTWEGKDFAIGVVNDELRLIVKGSKLITTVLELQNYLSLKPTTLTYQLATPIEIPMQTSGSLVSYPSGTVYIEPFVADAGIYTDKMSVLHQDLPIKALEKISKVDFDTGLETELDITAAVIAEDKLSFTHPNLTSGDIVFFTYEYDRESTEGETEIEYYDSRYVIKDSATEKFYKWHIAVANGVPSIELVEV
jgi:hypothetical protein